MKALKIWILITVSLLLGIKNSLAGQVTLHWEPTQTYASGAPIEGPIGYAIYIGTSPNKMYSKMYDIGKGHDSNITCTRPILTKCRMKEITLYGLSQGTYYIAATTYTLSTGSGCESYYSDEISETITDDSDEVNLTAVHDEKGVHLSWTNPQKPDLATLIMQHSESASGVTFSTYTTIAKNGEQKIYEFSTHSPGIHTFRVIMYDSDGNTIGIAETSIEIKK